MGTRADFYVGRGKSAEWLGSIAWDGYPDGIAADVIQASTEDGFRKALDAFCGEREDVTSPADGWPWPWDDSGTSDYAYCFDGGKVWYFGTPEEADDSDSQCWISLQGGTETFDRETREEYPNMKDRQKVQYGKKSGLIIIGPDGPIGEV